MNPKYFLWIAIGALLPFMSSCKKDEKVAAPEEQPTILPCDQNTTSFFVNLNSSDTFYDVNEDLGGNIVILGRNTIIKYDYKGNLVWSKNIISQGTPQNIIQADGDNYFTTGSTINISTFKADEFYLNGEVEGRELHLTTYFSGYPLYDRNCTKMYSLIQKSNGQSPDIFKERITLPVNNSKCFLNKIDKDGNLLWTKTFDGNYFKGKSICKTGDGGFALLTYSLKGFYQTLDLDANGVFQDSIHVPMDENRVTVHKFDRDGNVEWTKTMDGIVCEQCMYSTYSEVNNGAWIVATEGRIFVQTSRKIFMLDNAGKLLKEMKPYGNYCEGRGNCLTTFNNRAYSLGFFSSTFGTGDSYINSFDESGFEALLLQSGPPLSIGRRSPAFIVGDGIITVSNGIFIEKTDKSHRLMWSLNAGKIMCVNQTCREGIAFVTNKSGTPQLIKTDRNGLY